MYNSWPIPAFTCIERTHIKSYHTPHTQQLVCQHPNNLYFLTHKRLCLKSTTNSWSVYMQPLKSHTYPSPLIMHTHISIHTRAQVQTLLFIKHPHTHAIKCMPTQSYVHRNRVHISHICYHEHTYIHVLPNTSHRTFNTHVYDNFNTNSLCILGPTLLRCCLNHLHTFIISFYSSWCYFYTQTHTQIYCIDYTTVSTYKHLFIYIHACLTTTYIHIFNITSRHGNRNCKHEHIIDHTYMYIHYQYTRHT